MGDPDYAKKYADGASKSDVLGKLKQASDARFVDYRGATYLFEGEDLLYEYKHRGVLTYSATMPRPLTFLVPYIGAKALNPLGLGDDGVAKTR